MKRRLLVIDAAHQRWHLRTLDAVTPPTDPRQDYGLLAGESLCQLLLREVPDSLSIARGSLPFLAGNKATLGYVSPLTGLPHYSFVGGRAAAQILNLGLDGIVLRSPVTDRDAPPPYVVASGRAPDLGVEFRAATGLPRGQRAAYYWLVERELSGSESAGSVLTIGEAAYQGYRSANLAGDAIYHAGRGGCGAVFVRFASALVLRGDPLTAREALPRDETAFSRRPNAEIDPLLHRYCSRFIEPQGGTIPKLFDTGRPGTKPTLPAHNARTMGYSAADLGSERVLKATRDGRTGCQWCPLDCRFYHWIEADYAPGGHDRLLDDFEPTFALFAMLGLEAAGDSVEDRVALRREVERGLVVPIEQLGLDVIDLGLALAALFEGIENGAISADDVPPALREARLGRLSSAATAVGLLASGEAGASPALAGAASGPQALAEAYPELRDSVFTSGRNTLGNAGHCNALWTFLMPFSRFFGHYVGQTYKIDERLPAPGAPEAEYAACFERVIRRMLDREAMGVLCNALSMCAFVFVIFTQDGGWEALDDDDTLVRTLAHYGIHTTRADLMWFARAFWAQSMALKGEYGWEPPGAGDLPRRVYEALSIALERPVEELQALMGMLIAEWRRQAGATMARFGYEDWRRADG
jgi:aldehyde:ferredoxin oxidoreductase